MHGLPDMVTPTLFGHLRLEVVREADGVLRTSLVAGRLEGEIEDYDKLIAGAFGLRINGSVWSL